MQRLTTTKGIQAALNKAITTEFCKSQVPAGTSQPVTTVIDEQVQWNVSAKGRTLERTMYAGKSDNAHKGYRP